MPLSDVSTPCTVSERGEGEGFNEGGRCVRGSPRQRLTLSPQLSTHHANARKRFSICASQIQLIVLSVVYTEHVGGVEIGPRPCGGFPAL